MHQDKRRTEMVGCGHEGPVEDAIQAGEAFLRKLQAGNGGQKGAANSAAEKDLPGS